MRAIIQHFLSTWGLLHRDPRTLIARYGGVDTTAVITGFTDNRHGRALTYCYTDAAVEGSFSATTLAKIADPHQRADAFRRMVQGTWDRHYTGSIQTDWDVQDILLHGGQVPYWFERYQEGYAFPIRYLTRNPAIHYIVEAFDFRR
jgi:hypothetical protein